MHAWPNQIEWREKVLSDSIHVPVSYRSSASLAVSEEKFERIQSLLVIKEWQLSISQNMSKFQVVIQLLLALQTFGSPVELLSQLPEDPIDPPNDWAWGLHPNGLGYKASNDLLYKTCVATPNSPLCYGAATLAQCTKRSIEAIKIKKTCMCAQHIPETKCTSIGAV